MGRCGLAWGGRGAAVGWQWGGRGVAVGRPWAAVGSSGRQWAAVAGRLPRARRARAAMDAHEGSAELSPRSRKAKSRRESKENKKKQDPEGYKLARAHQEKARRARIKAANEAVQASASTHVVAVDGGRQAATQQPSPPLNAVSASLQPHLLSERAPPPPLTILPASISLSSPTPLLLQSSVSPTPAQRFMASPPRRDAEVQANETALLVLHCMHLAQDVDDVFNIEGDRLDTLAVESGLRCRLSDRAAELGDRMMVEMHGEDAVLAAVCGEGDASHVLRMHDFPRFANFLADLLDEMEKDRDCWMERAMEAEEKLERSTSAVRASGSAHILLDETACESSLRTV